MNTCFIFIDNPIEERLNDYADCIVLSLTGEIIHPLTSRSFEEIRAFSAKNIVILSSSCASLRSLNLPWLGEKKARTAIPFALEEELAQNVSELHVAYDRRFFKDNVYLVSIIEKEILSKLIFHFKQHSLNIHSISLDWFALDPNEMLLTTNYLLISMEVYKGYLDIAFKDKFFKESTDPLNFPLLYCSSKAPEPMISCLEKMNVLPCDKKTWLAQRLLNRPMINLCQGNLQQTHLQKQTRRYYYYAGAALALWLFSFIAIHSIELYQLSPQLQRLDTEIEDLYKVFFPEAKQVINPKFRITQLMKNGQYQHSQAFWILMNALSQEIDRQQVEIDNLRFQADKLFLTVHTQTFEALEQFQDKLKRVPLKVKQTQASTQDTKVLGILELSL